MIGVKHMKWWGWGVEGVGFNYLDKPRFAPFVLSEVGVDVTTPGNAALDFEDLDIPKSRLGDELRGVLTEIVGAEFATSEDMERVVHAYGKSVRDLIRLRRGYLPRIPDVVIYPSTTEETQAIVDAVIAADAVLIPFGGGSNISGSLEADPHEDRAIVSLDLGRMNKVIEIDTESGLATIGAGTLGPDIEAQLNPQGWTMGHFPDSFTHSTLGGWIATRSSGMQSDRYGDIADITRGLTMAMPGETLTLRPLPSSSTGPSVREMVLGSEGRLGVITEAVVNVHKIAEERQIIAYFFPDFASALLAAKEIKESDVDPLVVRISDHRETAFTFATSKKSKGVSKYVTQGLMKYLTHKGWDLSKMCLSFIGYEGGKSYNATQRKQVKQIVTKHGGIVVGKGPGILYDQKKFDTPYIRDFLLDRGATADVSETAAPWGDLKPLYNNVIAAVENAFEEIGCQGYVMCHLSHNYHSGACLYFTFAFVYEGSTEETLHKYDVVKRAAQSTFLASHGTLSHHHGVGLEHSPWMAQDISPAGQNMIAGLFSAVDAGSNLNPGKIVHAGEPGIQANSAEGLDQHGH